MQYKSVTKNIKISPRKVRLIATAVKKLEVPMALISLSRISNRSAIPLKKAIESAIANAKNNFKADKDKLTISDILVNEGISYKRFHFAGRGRTRPYKKRTSHITVVLSDKLEAISTKPEKSLEIKSLEKEEKITKPKTGKEKTK